VWVECEIPGSEASVGEGVPTRARVDRVRTLGESVGEGVRTLGQRVRAADDWVLLRDTKKTAHYAACVSRALQTAHYACVSSAAVTAV
jgi:NADPH:quinone reductase-like Zn-dependent oxidoreductase